MAKRATRTETDSLGAIEVPADAYWGAQTQRAFENFIIGDELMPLALIHALALVKKSRLGSTHGSPSCPKKFPAPLKPPPMRLLPAGTTITFRLWFGKQARARKPT